MSSWIRVGNTRYHNNYEIVSPIFNYQTIYFLFQRFTSTAVTGLSSGHEYEFRVYAENVYGRSKPSDVSPIIRTKELKKKPPKTKHYESKFTHFVYY